LYQRYRSSFSNVPIDFGSKTESPYRSQFADRSEPIVASCAATVDSDLDQWTRSTPFTTNHWSVNDANAFCSVHHNDQPTGSTLKCGDVELDCDDPSSGEPVNGSSSAALRSTARSAVTGSRQHRLSSQGQPHALDRHVLPSTTHSPAMIDVFKSLRSLVKISRLQIDNNVLRLHYSFTVLLLMAFCVVVSTKQYVGEPIDCVRSEAVPQSVINTYCWMHTTYTIPRSLLKKVGVEVPHPGIDQVTDSREFRYHSYYQWVCFVLFVQATLFYAPRWLWKLWEGGKLQALVMDLEVANCSNKVRKSKCELLANYLLLSRGHHDWYAARYVFTLVHNPSPSSD
jgi:hypothetical protein